MKTYHVKIQETLCMTVEIEAKCRTKKHDRYER